MLVFILRRILFIVPALLLVSFLIFAVMQFQQGDFVDQISFGLGSAEAIQAMRELYGLNAPWYEQYGKWIYGIIGRPQIYHDEAGNVVFPFIHFEPPDFGISFRGQQSVIEALFLTDDRLQWTLMIMGFTFLFSWMIGIPVGIYSATAKDSLSDHLIRIFGFLGLSLPNFFLAALIFWVLAFNFGFIIVGILDTQYVEMSWWNPDKWLNFFWHLWPVLLVVGLANMTQLIRYMRGSLLDVLAQPYVQTARAKGVSERLVIWKHAVRNALNPLISVLGFWVPFLFESLLVAAVMFELPVVEMGFWNAIVVEDQYVVMSGLFFFAAILFVGNLISDLLLMLVDPRIRYE